MNILTFSNQKGGVGKTTSVLNVSAGLAYKNFSVLAIDLDPQAHLTTAMGISPYEQEITVYDLLLNQHDLPDATVNVFNEQGRLDLIPSNIDLSTAIFEVINEPGREFLLSSKIDQATLDYDYVLIDCPPSLDILTINALTAATGLIIPIQTEYFATHGIVQLMNVYNKVKEKLNKDLKLFGVLITLYDQRKIIHQEIAHAISGTFPGKVFDTKIRNNIALAESPSDSKDIFKYRNKSHGSEDYMNLVEEIIAGEKIG